MALGIWISFILSLLLMTTLGRADPSSKDHLSGQIRFVTFAYIPYFERLESVIIELRGVAWLL
jgi:hypothetical protein